ASRPLTLTLLVSQDLHGPAEPSEPPLGGPALRWRGRSEWATTPPLPVPRLSERRRHRRHQNWTEIVTSRSRLRFLVFLIFHLCAEHMWYNWHRKRDRWKVTSRDWSKRSIPASSCVFTRRRS